MGVPRRHGLLAGVRKTGAGPATRSVPEPILVIIDSPVSRGAARPRDAAVQDGELVAEERVLGHEFRLAPPQIGEGAGSQGRDSRTRGGQQPTAEAVSSGAADRDQAVQQVDRHGQLLLGGRRTHRAEASVAALARGGSGL